jgi:hypothetical protein
MGPPWYIWSVVDRNVVIRRISVYILGWHPFTCRTWQQKQFHYFERSTICEFLGFRSSSVFESSIFPGCGARSLGHGSLTFRDSIVVSNKELIFRRFKIRPPCCFETSSIRTEISGQQFTSNNALGDERTLLFSAARMERRYPTCTEFAYPNNFFLVANITTLDSHKLFYLHFVKYKPN